MNEIVNAVIKQKFGAFVRSRLWWEQFHELVIKASFTTWNGSSLFHTRSATVRDSVRNRLLNTVHLSVNDLRET